MVLSNSSTDLQHFAAPRHVHPLVMAWPSWKAKEGHHLPMAADGFCRLARLALSPLVHQNELNPRKINNSFEASQILVWTSLTRGHHTVPVIARGLFQGFSLRFRQTCCRKRNPRRLRVGPRAAWLMNPLIKESNILSINNIYFGTPDQTEKNTCLGIATQNSILELHENFSPKVHHQRPSIYPMSTGSAPFSPFKCSTLWNQDSPISTHPIYAIKITIVPLCNNITWIRRS